MKIIQLVSNLNYGDGIGNDVVAIHNALLRAGYEAEIMATSVHEKLAHLVRQIDYSEISLEDILLFHKGSAYPVADELSRLTCYKIMIYHNITPARFFLAYDPVLAWYQVEGRRQLKKELKVIDEAWGDSAYNCRELIERGFPAKKTKVLPILLNLSSAGKEVSGNSSGTNILFIGRVAPNKKQEDVIKAFYCYLEYDPTAKLYLVGSWSNFEKYYAKLKGFCADLGLTDKQVVFTGHVTDEEKKQYLSRADLLVCMSEHEGFCIPLLEAMAYDIPVLAYRAAAVPETVGENGLLFADKDYDQVAAAMHRVRTDTAFRDWVLEKQRSNLERFNSENTEKKLLSLIQECIESRSSNKHE